jgi:hypothetical protein
MNKTMRNAKVLLMSAMCAGAIGATSITVSAQTQATPAEVARMTDAEYDALYAVMDANKDGMISRDEYVAYYGSTYDRMDSGKKGNMSRQDMRTRMFEREIRKTDGNPQGNSSMPGSVQRK